MHNDVSVTQACPSPEREQIRVTGSGAYEKNLTDSFCAVCVHLLTRSDRRPIQR